MPPVKNKATAKKRERQSISLEVKSKILAMNGGGASTSSIAHQLKLPRTTVQTIIKEKPKIARALANAATMTSTTIRKHQGLISEMEKLLFMWMQDQTQRSVQLSLALIQNKALSLFKTLKESKESVDGQQTSFAASRGWYMRFKKRYSLHSISQQEEAASAVEFPETLWKIIQEESLSPKQVFNVDETELFWKKLPAQTYISQEEKSMPGFKAAKDRLTLLFGSNAEGDFKLKPLLVYRAENPRALKNHNKACLPVIWKSHPKAWVTANLFEEWIKNDFIPEVKNYCAKNSLPYKALLLVDNGPSHPLRIADIDPQIKIVFLPPHTTAFLQPMDQGITASFKAYYLRITLAQAVTAHDVNGTDLKTFWKHFNILDGVKNIATSWNEVKSSHLKGVWKKVCPQFFVDEVGDDFDPVTSVNEITEDIANIANNLPGIEINSDDVKELLASHSEELSNEDLVELEEQRQKDDQEASGSSSVESKQLTSNKLIEAFNHIHAAMQIFESNDPNFERSFEVNSNIFRAYKCYREIHQMKKKEATQTLRGLLQKQNTINI